MSVQIVVVLLDSTYHLSIMLVRALDKKGHLMIIEDNFSYFSLKPYAVTPHVNSLYETVQMRGHNMFLCRINKNYP